MNTSMKLLIARQAKLMLESSNHHTIKPSEPQMDYSSPNDLPFPLRQKLVELRRKGMPIAKIAALFFLPVEWVVLFVETPPGSTEH